MKLSPALLVLCLFALLPLSVHPAGQTAASAAPLAASAPTVAPPSQAIPIPSQAPPQTIPAPPQIDAKGFLLIDFQSGTVLAESKSDRNPMNGWSRRA